MKYTYGYIRVSDPKQGKGVSLQEQKEAIIRYAKLHNLTIIEWFEEQKTAAKQGRPVFSQMMKLLRQRKADGAIMHKIDRSARNLRDWADLGDLIDEGIEVHFAHETLDMNARGGRLSADIQAVIASDYIRNLRQETIKGLYGRLKQGIYPFKAPTGYLDAGKGQPKKIDPEKAPLTKEIFELYGYNNYSLVDLAQPNTPVRLRKANGKPLDKNQLSKILNNPFYTGMMRVKGKLYKGQHKPLITTTLYNAVQDKLQGRLVTRTQKHNFLFRRQLKCQHCGYSLIGELQKGHIYYRCHTKNCPTTSMREDVIENYLMDYYQRAELLPEESKSLTRELENMKDNWHIKKENLIQSIRLKMNKTDDRLTRLTDAYLDTLIDQETFEQRKARLLMDKQRMEEELQDIEQSEEAYCQELQQNLELAQSLTFSYKSGIPEEKRVLVSQTTSNLVVDQKNLIISMKSPFMELANRGFLLLGDLSRTSPRTGISKIVFGPGVSNDLLRGQKIANRGISKLIELLLSKCEEE